MPPTSGWTAFSVEGRVFPISVGPAQRAGPTVMGKTRPLTENPVQPDIGGTLVWVGWVSPINLHVKKNVLAREELDGLERESSTNTIRVAVAISHRTAISDDDGPKLKIVVVHPQVL